MGNPNFQDALNRVDDYETDDLIERLRELDKAPHIDVTSWEADFLNNALSPRAAHRTWTKNQKATAIVMLDEYDAWDL